MKSTKKFALVLAVMMVLVAMASAASAAEVNLRFAGQFPPDHTATGFMKEVAKEVAAKSNGRIDIKIFPANQLGDYTLVYEELIRGTIDMALISVPSQFDPRMELVYINGFVTGYDGIKKAFKPNGWMAKKMDEFHTRLGVKFLGFNVEGMIGIGSTKPVRDPLNPTVNKGVLTRVPFMDVYKTGVEAMGYKTISLPYADIFQACHRRTIIDPNRRKEIDPPRPYSYHWDCEDHQGGSENDKEWANTDDKTGSTIWSNSVRNREEIGHIQEHCEEIYQRCT